MAPLLTYGMERCPFCAKVTAHDRVCGGCGVGGHKRVSDAPARKLVRCAGWGCSLKDRCQRYLEPGNGPSTTVWMEPPYDRMLGTCGAHRPGKPLDVPRPLSFVEEVPTFNFPKAWDLTEVVRNTPCRVRTLGRHRLVVGMSYWRVYRYTQGAWVLEHEKRHVRSFNRLNSEALNAREAFDHYMNNLYHA